VIAKTGVELEKWMREKLGLEALVRESEEKAKSVELKFFGLQKEVEEAEKVISGLKEKAVDAINGSVDGIRARVGGENKGLNLDWPVVAAGSTGAIAFAAAVAYVIYVRRR
jgi:tropomyosin-2